MSPVSKQLLSELYANKLDNVNQLISRLSYSVQGGNPAFRERWATLLPQVSAAMSRYLKGTGHPDHPMINGLVDHETRVRDSRVPCFRARRFLKVVSGNEILPPNDAKFNVIITHLFQV